MTNGTKYPDLEPNGLGDLKEIRRLPTMQKRPPKIRWGDEYQGWPIEKRLSYAERLAAAMNHAADVLQTERADLIDLAKRQEEQIAHSEKQYLKQGEVMHAELAREGAEKQDLYKTIVSLQSQLKACKARLKELEESGDHD